MKTIWAMIAALLGSIVIMEIGIIFTTYNKINTSIGQALDAAIIAGVKPELATKGQLYIDTTVAEQKAKEIFVENLGLDPVTLENDIMKKTTFDIKIHQDNTSGSKPYVDATANTSVAIASPTFFGQPVVPITVRKYQFCVTTYK